jgi:hypothetical protein
LQWVGLVLLIVLMPVIVVMLVANIGIGLLQVLGVSAAIGFLLNLFKR